VVERLQRHPEAADHVGQGPRDLFHVLQRKEVAFVCWLCGPRTRTSTKPVG
jgi:hypothetical protein